MSRPVAHLHLRSGAELIAEPFDGLSDAMTHIVAEARRQGALDGGLELLCDSGPLCHGHIWDRLDGLLLAWLKALDEIEAGASEAIAVFPDTRIECELSACGAGRVKVAYEDIDAEVEGNALREVIEEAAQRLLAAVGTQTDATSALLQLAARWGREPTRRIN